MLYLLSHKIPQHFQHFDKKHFTLYRIVAKVITEWKTIQQLLGHPVHTEVDILLTTLL